MELRLTFWPPGPPATGEYGENAGVYGDVLIWLYLIDGSWTKQPPYLAACTAQSCNGECTLPATMDTTKSWRLRVQSLQNNGIDDYSDSVFTVVAHDDVALTISAPNGAESWQRGGSHSITWSSNVNGNVDLYLYNNWTKLYEIDPTVAKVAKSGAYAWTIPADQVLAATYRVRVQYLHEFAVPYGQDYSDSLFTITD